MTEQAKRLCGLMPLRECAADRSLGGIRGKHLKGRGMYETIQKASSRTT